MSTFGPRDATWVDLDDVFTAYLPPALMDARTSGERGMFASDEALSDSLTAHGFEGVTTVHLDVRVRFTGLAQWKTWSWSHGQRTHWLAVPDDRRDAVLADAAERVRSRQEESGAFTLHQRVRLTSGRRPGGVSCA